MLSLADLDLAPVGWLEELALQEAGWDMAVAVAQHRSKSKTVAAPAQQPGQAVFGMPGVRYEPGKGFA